FRRREPTGCDGPLDTRADNPRRARYLVLRHILTLAMGTPEVAQHRFRGGQVNGPRPREGEADQGRSRTEVQHSADGSRTSPAGVVGRTAVHPGRRGRRLVRVVVRQRLTVLIAHSTTRT